MQEDLNNIIGEIEKAHSTLSLENFLSGLLTPAEIREFAQRIEIVRLLKRSVPQQEIAKRLGVGVATVTRGSREIQRGNFKTVK